MENAVSVDTLELGILNGRDCIYFTTVKQDDMDNLIFKGEINGSLVSRRKNEKEWFSYTLTFERVIAYFA